MKPNPDAAPAAPRKPRLAVALATVFGTGYVPKAPGTLGSVVGVALVLATYSPWAALALLDAGFDVSTPFGHPVPAVVMFSVALFFGVALLGVWSASRVAAYEGSKDPQHVVIDEVSGLHLTLLLGAGTFIWENWKCLLLGFILFRVFDIWKPFPVRQAEKLSGGWGIMADDWVAGVYAALGLWVARYLGL